jgi:hypothetical protein
MDKTGSEQCPQVDFHVIGAVTSIYVIRQLTINTPLTVIFLALVK